MDLSVGMVFFRFLRLPDSTHFGYIFVVGSSRRALLTLLLVGFILVDWRCLAASRSCEYGVRVRPPPKTRNKTKEA